MTPRAPRRWAGLCAALTLGRPGDLEAGAPPGSDPGAPLPWSRAHRPCTCRRDPAHPGGADISAPAPESLQLEAPELEAPELEAPELEALGPEALDLELSALALVGAGAPGAWARAGQLFTELMRRACSCAAPLRSGAEAPRLCPARLEALKGTLREAAQLLIDWAPVRLPGRPSDQTLVMQAVVMRACLEGAARPDDRWHWSQVWQGALNSAHTLHQALHPPGGRLRISLSELGAASLLGQAASLLPRAWMPGAWDGLGLQLMASGLNADTLRRLHQLWRGECAAPCGRYLRLLRLQGAPGRPATLGTARPLGAVEFRSLLDSFWNFGADLAGSGLIWGRPAALLGPTMGSVTPNDPATTWRTRKVARLTSAPTPERPWQGPRLSPQWRPDPGARLPDPQPAWNRHDWETQHFKRQGFTPRPCPVPVVRPAARCA